MVLYLQLSLQTVFHKYEHFFLLKTGNLITNWIPLSLPHFPTNIHYLKEYPQNLTKYEINVTSKTSISQLFSELGKIWKYNLGLYLKKQFSIFFINWEKLEISAMSNNQKSQNLFANRGNLGVQPNSTIKNHNFESMDELGNVMF